MSMDDVDEGVKCVHCGYVRTVWQVCPNGCDTSPSLLAQRRLAKGSDEQAARFHKAVTPGSGMPSNINNLVKGGILCNVCDERFYTLSEFCAHDHTDHCFHHDGSITSSGMITVPPWRYYKCCYCSKQVSTTVRQPKGHGPHAPYEQWDDLPKGKCPARQSK